MPLSNQTKPDYTTQDNTTYKTNIDGALNDIIDQPEVRLPGAPLFHAPFKNSLAFDGAGTITYTRASTATYLDRYNVVQTAAIDIPRFEKNGLLIEGASTNLLTRSEDFSHADWTLSNTPVITTNTTVAPDGATTADSIEDNDGSGSESLYQTAGSFTVTDWYCASVYIDKDAVGRATRFPALLVQFLGSTTEDNEIRFDTSTGESNLNADDPNAIAGVIDVGNYYRIFVAAKSVDQSNTSVRWQLYPARGADGAWGSSNAATGTVIVWGAQLETLAFMSSYIPTTSTTVTRSADICELSYTDNIPNLNDDISFIIDIYLSGHDDDRNQYAFTMTDASIIEFVSSNTNNQSGIGMGTGTTNASNPAARTLTRFAASGVADDGELITYANNVKINTDANRGTVTGTLGDIDIGRDSAGADTHLFGNISNFRIYDIVLTEDQMGIL